MIFLDFRQETLDGRFDHASFLNEKQPCRTPTRLFFYEKIELLMRTNAPLKSKVSRLKSKH